MGTLNLGILAHVDAGKTTQTDFLALERQRGITIKSAVVSFAIGDLTVNLIDTPGHPDFIAEVERVLSVLDGVVLVVSAVEGVQAQTRVLMRTLQRLGIATLIFVNKIDRCAAGPRPGREPIATRSTARSTCCACRAGSAGETPGPTKCVPCPTKSRPATGVTPAGRRR